MLTRHRMNGMLTEDAEGQRARRIGQLWSQCAADLVLTVYNVIVPPETRAAMTVAPVRLTGLFMCRTRVPKVQTCEPLFVCEVANNEPEEIRCVTFPDDNRRASQEF